MTDMDDNSFDAEALAAHALENPADYNDADALADVLRAATSAIEDAAKVFRRCGIQDLAASYEASASEIRKFLRDYETGSLLIASGGMTGEGGDGWRDIATAPKDGTLVVIAGPSASGDPTDTYVCAGYFYGAARRGKGCWLASSGFGADMPAANEPKFWTPLPAAPTEAPAPASPHLRFVQEDDGA